MLQIMEEKQEEGAIFCVYIKAEGVQITAAHSTYAGRQRSQIHPGPLP